MTWHAMSSFLFLSLLLAISQAQTDDGHSDNNSHRNLLLVVNQGDQSMSIVDPAAGVAVGKVKTTEVRARDVTASAHGRLAYLPIYGNSGLCCPGPDRHRIEIVEMLEHTVA